MINKILDFITFLMGCLYFLILITIIIVGFLLLLIPFLIVELIVYIYAYKNKKDLIKGV